MVKSQNLYALELTRYTGYASIGKGGVNLKPRVTVSKLLKIFSDNCKKDIEHLMLES